MTIKTTAAKKAPARKLALTSRAKMGKARTPATRKAPATTNLKELLAASTEAVAERVAPVIAATGLDGDSGLPAEAIGEPVVPTAAPKVDRASQHGERILALLSRPERTTPREMMDATGLGHGALKGAVSRLLKERRLKIALQRHPSPDPADRALTSYLYGVEKA